MGYIQIIKSSESPKVYIGQTRRKIEQRFKEHLTRDKDTKLSQAIKKYGQDCFSIEILEEVPDEFLNEKECFQIDKYNSFNDGYNMTPGGFNIDNAIVASCKPVEKRDKNTQELIKTYPSLAEAARDLGLPNPENLRKNLTKCCHKEVHVCYGYRWNFVGDPVDTLKMGDKRKIPIIMCDKENHKDIKEFDSAHDAAVFLNKTNGGQITACCKGRKKSA